MSAPKVPNVQNVTGPKCRINSCMPDARGRLLALDTLDPETYQIFYREGDEEKSVTIITNHLLIALGEQDAENSGQSDDNGGG